MKTIKEKNKTIAEFMELPKYGETEFLHNNKICNFSDMQYILSWDWIIPVLQKIDSLEIEIPEDSNLYGDITSALLNFDIDSLYDAIIEFIKWYNLNQ